MLRIVMWVALACAVLLAALALSRGVRFTSDPKPPAPVEQPKAPAVEEAAKPAAVVAPEPPAPPPPPIDDQVAEDAAAVGMTTREPVEADEAKPEPSPAQSPPPEPARAPTP